MAATATKITVVCGDNGECRADVFLYLVIKGDLILPDDSKRFRPVRVDDIVSGKRIWMVEVEIHEEAHVFYHFVQDNKVIMKVIGSDKPPAKRNNRKEMGALPGAHAVVTKVGDDGRHRDPSPRRHAPRRDDGGRRDRGPRTQASAHRTQHAGTTRGDTRRQGQYQARQSPCTP